MGSLQIDAVTGLLVGSNTPQGAGSNTPQGAGSNTPQGAGSNTPQGAGVRQVLSPHCDERPSGMDVDLIVVHGISLPPGEFGGPWIDRFFAGNLPADAHPYFREIAGMRVSAHVVIRRTGEIVQYVPFGQRAWHAGASQYQGRSSCNDFSVGIELEGTDDRPYTDAQYDGLAALIEALLAAYPTLSRERIAGHSDIAPGRKSDPGPAFDWPRLRARLAT